jgi:hypothetical protein
MSPALSHLRDADEPTHLLPYYVYELRDPRDNAVFYVGKGTRDRVFFHDAGDESAKQRRIAAIQAAGQSVIRVVVARFETEAEAFAAETVLIKWVYGFAALTNAIHGHRAAFCRADEEWRQQAYTTLPGVDVERVPVGLREGTYTQRQRDRILENGIVEKLWAAYDALTAHFGDESRCDIGEPDLSVPQDPHLLINGFSARLRLMLRLPLNGRAFRLHAVPAEGGSRAALADAMKWIDPAAMVYAGTCYRCYAPVVGIAGSPADRHGNVPLDDPDGLVRMIRTCLARLRTC